MFNLWEWIKDAGSLVGLATGIFVVWDRWRQHAPEAFFATHKFESGTRKLELRIANTRHSPIFVWLSTGGKPGRFSIAVDQKTESVLRAVRRGVEQITIDGGTTANLNLVRPFDFHALVPTAVLTAEFKWRPVDSR